MVPLLAVIVIFAVSPISAVVGVPVIAPVALSKLAQAGGFSIAKVIVGAGGVAVGWKL